MSTPCAGVSGCPCESCVGAVVRDLADITIANRILAQFEWLRARCAERERERDDAVAELSAAHVSSTKLTRDLETAKLERVASDAAHDELAAAVDAMHVALDSVGIPAGPAHVRVGLAVRRILALRAIVGAR